MKKRAVKIVVGVLVVLVIVAVVAWLMIDAIAKAGVEKGATYALEVPTQVEKMRVSLLGGQIMMDGLKVANPQGFTTPYLMDSGRFNVVVRPGSLTSDTIEVSKFELDGLDINVEQRLTGSNVSKILDNLKRFDTGQGEGKKQETPEGEAKKVRVNTIVIKNVVAHFHLLPELSPTPLTVKVPEIELTEVSSGDGGGVTTARLVAKVVPAILIAVAEQAKGTVPGDFLKGLDTQLAEMKGLAAQMTQVTKQVGEQLKAVTESGGKAAKEAGKALKDLLGGKKKEEQK